MRKYRIVSGAFKDIKRKLEPWEEYLRREHWRERYRERMERKRRVMLFGEVIEMISESENVAEKAISNVDYENLHRALLTLNEKERYIIKAYYFQQMSDREIGEVTGNAQQTVNDVRHAVLYKMLKILEGKK